MILVTTPGDVRTRGHAAAGSRSCSPATRTRSPGCGPAADIAALIDAGEQPLNLNLHWFPIRTYLYAGRRI
jgi:hypothetical protein